MNLKPFCVLLLLLSGSLIAMEKDPEEISQAFYQTMQDLERALKEKSELELAPPKDDDEQFTIYTLKLFEWKIPYLFRRAQNQARVIQKLPGGEKTGAHLLEQLQRIEKAFEEREEKKKHKKINLLKRERKLPEPISKKQEKKESEIRKEMDELKRELKKAHPELFEKKD